MDEAFKLGDRVAIMQDGRLIQIDTPEQMSTNPANEYVRTVHWQRRPFQSIEGQ
jgi:glycine betaine/proline transport system ATP-binding protein